MPNRARTRPHLQRIAAQFQDWLLLRHLLLTHASLTRKERGNVENPRHVFAFQVDFDGFVAWSTASGASLDSELELFDPVVVEGTRAIRKHEREWTTDRRSGEPILLFHRNEGVEHDESAAPQEWVTDYSVRWVSHDHLRRRMNLDSLTAYGRQRLKALKKSARRGKTLYLKVGGKRMSARQWATQPGVTVSDKVIAYRKTVLKWTDRDAIYTPGQRPGRKPKSQ
jgi:hypothetical protein